MEGEENKGTEEIHEEKEGTEEIHEEEVEVDNDNTSKDEVILDEEDRVDRPEVLKAIEILQESGKQQLAAYNHLAGAIPSMTNTEVKKVAKTIPKPDIGVPHSVLKTYDEDSDVNFHHMLVVRQHLFEHFAARTAKSSQKSQSLLKICTRLNVLKKKVLEILKGEKYLGGSASYKRKLTTPQKRIPVKVPKIESPSASTSYQ